MEIITYNDDNLSIEDIIDRIIKVRAIIINSDNKIYLSVYDGMYLFPGGKIEDGEDILKSVKREIKEETGIELDLEDQEPFLLVKQFLKNYPKRDSNNDFSNRLNEPYYYLIYTNEKINYDKMELMENELENGFHTIQVELDEIPLLLANNNSNNYRNKYFTREVESTVKVLKKIIVKK